MKQLNFGAGQDIKEGFDNADINPPSNLLFDFNKFPYPIEDNTYDYVYSCHVLEHLKDPRRVLEELYRITKPKGIIEIRVPHLNSEGAFSVLGHISYFSEHTFEDLVNPIGKTNIANKKTDFKILELQSIPTWFGQIFFIPWIRRKVSLTLRGIYTEVIFKVEVVE